VKNFLLFLKKRVKILIG